MDPTDARILPARVALSLGEAETAARCLHDAKQLIDSIQDVGVMREKHVELAARLDELDTTAAGRDPEFTAREFEVIALLPLPLANREIGEELFLSRNTTKTYLRRVHHELDAASREEAVLAARACGLLSDDRQPA